CLVALVAIDLAIVAWPSVATVARAAEARQLVSLRSAVAAVDERRAIRSADHTSAPRAMRFVGKDAWPPNWRQTRSTGQMRMLAVEASQRSSNYGRWHLMEDRAVF